MQPVRGSATASVSAIFTRSSVLQSPAVVKVTSRRQRVPLTTSRGSDVPGSRGVRRPHGRLATYPAHAVDEERYTLEQVGQGRRLRLRPSEGELKSTTRRPDFI